MITLSVLIFFQQYVVHHVSMEDAPVKDAALAIQDGQETHARHVSHSHRASVFFRCMYYHCSASILPLSLHVLCNSQHNFNA